MFKKWFSSFTLLLTLCFSGIAAAYPADPYSLVNEAASKTFARLQKDQPQIKQDPTYLRQIIRDELMPYVDNKFASYKVIGSNIKNTTPEQRERFVLAFTDYIVATYADALAKYDNQTIKVEQAKPIGDEKIVSVNVTVHSPGKPDVSVVFKLRQNNKTGEWKAFDMVAENVSLLASKQSELGGMIRDKGIDAVSSMLEEHNKKPVTVKKS
ncbi:MAG: phospholipid-binding protein MlaC [Aeromonadaceae bacterium]|nr:phospholipid-binding protein MlaC [Aeromonadaceae bacterium]